MNKTTGHAADCHARSLAEAIILQSIEDLWDPICRRDSQMFFESDGFVICSNIAGITHVKQLGLLRMLADAGAEIIPCKIRKACRDS